MGKRPQAQRPSRPQPDHIRSSRKPGGIIAEYGAAFFGGAVLIAAFGFAGHYIGQNAVAHNVEPAAIQMSQPRPIEASVKGSLFIDIAGLDLATVKAAREQVLDRSAKGDLPLADSKIAEDLPPTMMGSVREHQVASLGQAGKLAVHIEPASASIKDDPEADVKRLILQPKPAAKADVDPKLKETKQKAVALRRVRLAEENCLARAVYFEARSESELGQLAVAKVIINRTKTPGFPRTICGVVYQGSGSRNSCQFSFACDGLPDDVKSASAWSRSKRIAQKAIAGSANMGSAMGLATNYHADYVKPKWAKTMRRLVKIGRHIFYSDEG